MKIYGEELKRNILETKTALQKEIADYKKRMADGDTTEDWYAKLHEAENNLRECDMQLEILNGDGCMNYNAVFDENGKEVNVHSFLNNWGKFTVVGRGIFAPSRSALLKITGWTTKTIRVPAWTQIRGNGRGLLGVMNGSSEIVRWHTNMKTGKYVGFPN